MFASLFTACQSNELVPYHPLKGIPFTFLGKDKREDSCLSLYPLI